MSAPRYEPVDPDDEIGFDPLAADDEIEEPEGSDLSTPQLISRGMDEGVIGMAGVADMIANYAMKRARGVDPQSPNKMANATRNVLEFANSVFATGPNVPSLHDPVDESQMTDPERYTYRAARGAGATIPTLPLAAAYGPGAAALDVLSGIFGEESAGLAEDAGFGPLWQMAAGLIGSFTPGASARIARTSKRAVQRRIPRAAEKMNRRAAAEYAGEFIDDRRAAGSRLREHAEQAGRRAIEDPVQPGKVQMLTEEVLSDPENAIQPLGALAEPAIVDLSEEVATRHTAAGRSLRRDAGAIQQRNARVLARQAEEGFPAGQPGSTREVMAERGKAAFEKGSKLQEAVPNFGGIDPSIVQSAAGDMVAKASRSGALQKMLPQDLLDDIAGWGDDIELEDLRAVRSAAQAKFRNLGPTARDTVEAKWLNDIVTATKTTERELAKRAGGKTRQIALLDEANEAWARAKNLYGRNTPQMKAFNDYDDIAKGFRAQVLNNKRPGKVLREMMDAVGDNDEAMMGLQRLVRDEVFGADMEGIGKLATIGKINRHKVAIETVYGKGAANRMRRLVADVQRAKNSRIGSRNLRRGVGSGRMGGRGALAAGAMDWGVGYINEGAARTTARKVARLMGEKNPLDNEDVEIIISHALEDPLVFAGLMDELPAKAVPIWRERVRARLARRGARAYAAGLEDTE